MGETADEAIQFVLSTGHADQFFLRKLKVRHIDHREFVRMIDDFVKGNGFSTNSDAAVIMHVEKGKLVKSGRKLWVAYCPLLTDRGNTTVCGILRVLFSTPSDMHDRFAEKRAIWEAKTIMRDAGAAYWKSASIVLEGPYPDIEEVPW